MRTAFVDAADVEALLRSLDRTYLKPEVVLVVARLQKALAAPEPARYDMVQTGLGVGILPRADGKFIRAADVLREAHEENKDTSAR